MIQGVAEWVDEPIVEIRADGCALSFEERSSSSGSGGPSFEPLPDVDDNGRLSHAKP